MADEGLREIQLNGKQLVFLFMASTVVAVVIFLCGVMVGRGVRVQAARELADAPDAVLSDPTITPSDSVRAAAPPPPPVSPSSGVPSGGSEKLTYPERLGTAEPPEELKEPLTPSKQVDPTASALVRANPLEPATSPARSAKAIPATAPVGGANAEAPPAPKGGEFTEPPGTGFVVQVAATKSRAEATTIARRLTGKGYPAFVTVPGSRSPKVFRVRVGKYKDRKEVDSVAGRLRKEEQFKPWITR